MQDHVGMCWSMCSGEKVGDPFLMETDPTGRNVGMPRIAFTRVSMMHNVANDNSHVRIFICSLSWKVMYLPM